MGVGSWEPWDDNEFNHDVMAVLSLNNKDNTQQFVTIPRHIPWEMFWLPPANFFLPLALKQIISIFYYISHNNT